MVSAYFKILHYKMSFVDFFLLSLAFNEHWPSECNAYEQ